MTGVDLPAAVGDARAPGRAREVEQLGLGNALVAPGGELLDDLDARLGAGLDGARAADDGEAPLAGAVAGAHRHRG